MEKEEKVIKPMTFGSTHTFLRQCSSSWKLKAVSLAFSLLVSGSTVCASDWTVKAQTVGESETIIDTIAATLDHLRDTFPFERFLLEYSDNKNFKDSFSVQKGLLFITDALTSLELSQK